MSRGFTTGHGRRAKFHPTDGSGSGRNMRAPSSGSSMSGVRRRRGQDKLPSAGIIHPGALTRHGYNLEEGEEKRHESLDKAVRQDGYKETIDRLAALEGVNKNRPEFHSKVKSDIEYLQKEHRPKA